MSGAETRRRILQSAERLMALNGISGTSVRQITEDAGANIAAVNYYFGGKDELLLELLKSRFDQLDVELLSGLEALADSGRARGSRPTVEEVAGVYFDTLMALGLNFETGGRDPFIKLIQRASSEQEAVLDRAQDYSAPGITTLVKMLGAAADPPVDLHHDADNVVGLMFSAAVTTMRILAEDGESDRRARAMRAYVMSGVVAFVDVLSRPADKAGEGNAGDGPLQLQQPVPARRRPR